MLLGPHPRAAAAAMLLSQALLVAAAVAWLRIFTAQGSARVRSAFGQDPRACFEQSSRVRTHTTCMLSQVCREVF